MPEAGWTRADLEGPRLDAARVEEILDEVLETEAAPAERPGQALELLAGHGEHVLDDEVERGDERGDRRPELVRHLHEELLLEPEELGLRGDVAHRVCRTVPRKRRRDDLEHTHPFLAREPGAPHEVTVGLLDRRRAGDEQELLEDLAEELLLAEDPERGRIRAGDAPGRVGEEDPVGQGDECLREGDLRERNVLLAPSGVASSFVRRRLAFRRASLGHSVGITKRTRVPWPGLESSESCAPTSRADSRICRRPRLPRAA